MQRLTLCFMIMAFLLVAQTSASAESSWTPEQQEIITTIQHLSATTAPEGSGAAGYAALLADDFSRWTTGSDVVNGKQEWVEGVRGWFEDGWRVVAREQDFVEILILGEYAFTRRVVTETYQSPDGESSASKAGLAETWLRSDDGWLLLRVNADILTGG